MTGEAKRDDERRASSESASESDSRGCPKCGFSEAEVDSISSTGSGLAALAEYQNQHFSVVSCARCGYSEFYRQGAVGDVRDLFLGVSFVNPSEKGTASIRSDGVVDYCSMCGAEVSENADRCSGCERSFA